MSRHPAFVAALIVLVVPSISQAEGEQTIVPENWQSCEVRPLNADNSDEGWGSIPQWAKAPHLIPLYQSNPRLLITHGLCNHKFKRLVLCGPGWDEDGDPEDPAHNVCQAVGKYRASHH